MTLPPHVLMGLHQLGEGGVERVTLHLANGFAERGNRVSLIVLRPGGVLEPRLSASVELVSPAAAARLRGPALLRSVNPVAQLVGSLAPDLLLSPGNHMHPLMVLAHQRAGAAERRLVIKLTNPVLRAGAGRARNAARTAFLRYAAARADLVLTLSSEAAAEASRLAPRARAKIRAVDNPYLEDRSQAAAAARACDPPLLLSAGRLTAQKDPLMMLDALASLAGRPWQLVMFGDGPLREAVAARVRALAIEERVSMPGFVPDLAPWFERARLFLLSSRYEEVPAVLVEAADAGCPIVSTAASPALAALLREAPGARLVAPGDSAAFASAVARALDAPLPSGKPPWTGRFTIPSGVASHAAALGLR